MTNRLVESGLKCPDSLHGCPTKVPVNRIRNIEYLSPHEIILNLKSFRPDIDKSFQLHRS